MPIIGLNGFIIARAPAMLEMQDVNPHPQIPPQLQLYPGKFPVSRCKFSHYNPGKEHVKLLHDFGRVPAWLSGDSDSGRSNSLLLPSDRQTPKSLALTNQKKVVKRDLRKNGIKQGLQSLIRQSTSNIMSLRVQQQHQSLSEHLSHCASSWTFLQSFLKSSSCKMRWFENQKRPMRTLSSHLLQDKLDNFDGQPHNTRCNNCKAMMLDSYTPTSHVCYCYNSAAFRARNTLKPTRVTYIADGSKVARRQVTDFVPTITKSQQPLFRSAKKPRSSRRERNCIREKEVRMAIGRAKRVQKSLVPLVKEPNFLDADPKKENMRWLGNQPWNQALSHIFGDKSMLTSFNFPRDAIIGKGLPADNVWMIQNLYGRIKECTSLPLRPLKSQF